MIETERLYLREMNMDDYDALYKVFADSEIMKHYPYIFDEARVREWIERNMKRYKELGFGLWAVCLKDTNEVIGDCGFTLQVIDGETLPEIGYHIRADQQRKGYAKEAAMAVRDWAFENTDYDEIYSYMKYTNVGSYSTAIANGMKKVKEYPDPANEISYAFSITRDEWNAIKDAEIRLDLKDDQWPLEYIDHDRKIARAIIIDDEDNYYFVRAERDDDFGKSTLIETAGGGVEPGEAYHGAILRELNEELGAKVQILCKLGVVSDYYNLIHRHNLNNYFLCKVVSFGEKHMTQEEIDQFHLSTLKLKYEDAVKEYERCSCTPLGTLVMRRELPILKHAHEWLEKNR